MSTIAVFNQKGGVGKTTTTLNLTAALAKLNMDPVAIDLDPQAHLTLAFGLRVDNGAESIAAFFKDDKPLPSLIHELPSHVNLIPSHLELSKIEALHGKNTSIPGRLKQGIAEDLVAGGMPILIDCCPMLGVLSLNAVIAADKVLIPVSADFLSMQGVHRLDAALKALEGPLKRNIPRKIVMTRFDSRRKLSFEIYDRLKDRFGDLVCNTRIVENVALAESPAHGKDIFTFAPSSPGAKSYAALTQELAESGFFK